jgi:hypothetical protein
MVLTAYSALSPVTGLSCHRRPRKLPSANLTPASGRQDHTTSPSASGALRRCVPSASTASRPAFVTIASRPSVGRDGARYIPDFYFGKTEIFFRKGLDKRPNAKSRTAPDGQITCVSKRSPEERSDIRVFATPHGAALMRATRRLSGRSNGKAYRRASRSADLRTALSTSKRSPDKRSDIRGLRNPAWRCAYAGYPLCDSARRSKVNCRAKACF